MITFLEIDIVNEIMF